MEIHFGPKPKEYVVDPDWLKADSNHEPEPIEEITEIEEVVRTKEDLEEELEAKAMELAFMAQEDPEGYENLITNSPELLHNFGQELGIMEDEDAEEDSFRT